MRRKLTLAEVERQVAETRSRPPLRLPAAWYEPGLAERMANWLKRQDQK